MKTSPMLARLSIVLAVLMQVASAGWIYPLSIWKPISFTLPGTSFRRRDLSELSENAPALLHERATSVDLYAACSTANMASKYKNYPINGYLYTGGVVGRGSASASAGGSSACAGTDPDCGFQGSLFNEQYSAASSAYDCCVQAQQLADSAFFFYTSNPANFDQKECTIVRTNYCTQQRYSVVLEAAAYNGSAPRGTSYYNYIGNGRCGPGVTAAINFPSGGLCAAAAASANGNSAGAASAAAAACGYTAPNVADAGGATPAG